MQKIKLVTDTACDIPQKYINQIDIEVLSFPITVDGVGYLEGVDFSSKEFIDILSNADEIPTTAAAFIGDVLGLRPILKIVNGEIKTIGKVRGDKSIAPEILKELESSRSKDDKYNDYLLLHGANKQLNNDLTKAVKKKLGQKFRGIYEIGAAIMINSGPNVSAVVYFGESKKEKIKKENIND